VIQWNGHRVFGVLAMSRSIGMHFLVIYLIFSVLPLCILLVTGNV